MAVSGSDRVRKSRAKGKSKGRKRRDMMLTDEEYSRVKRLVKRIRELRGDD